MKVVDIRIPYDLKDIDIENDNIDVFVDLDDGYSYTLSLATPKNLQFLMDQEKKDYRGPGYPFIIVTKLTPEIIEQAIKSFTEENGGYWLKVYYFGGWQGSIDESRLDQLKTKHMEERKKVDKLDALDLIREAKSTLKDHVNKRDLSHLVEQYRSGDKHLGIRTRSVPGTCLHELRVKSGARIYVQEENDKIEVVAICDKGSQDKVICTLTDSYSKETNAE